MSIGAGELDVVYWDPWDPGIFADPYPTFRLLREEAPLYRSDEHDFWALSGVATG